MGIVRAFLSGLVASKANMGDANTPPSWADSLDWHSWDAPLDIIRGESYRQKNLQTLAGKPRANGYLIPVTVALVREPENRYDPNAIKVEIEGLHVGYITKELAAKLAHTMDILRVPSFQVAGLIRGGSLTAPTLGIHVWPNKRITKGPVIEMPDELRTGYQVSWPPSREEGRETSEPQVSPYAELCFLPRSTKERPGYYQGKHYVEYVDLVKQLKRAGEYDKAEKLLLALIEAVESESLAEDVGVAPWYYEQLAILYKHSRFT